MLYKLLRDPWQRDTPRATIAFLELNEKIVKLYIRREFIFFLSFFYPPIAPPFKFADLGIHFRPGQEALEVIWQHIHLRRILKGGNDMQSITRNWLGVALK